MNRRDLLLLTAWPFGAGWARAEDDALLGSWQATLGTDDNRTQLALDVERGDGGRLRAYFTNTLLNFHRMALPPIEADGAGRWTIRAFDVQLRAAPEGRLEASGLMDDTVVLRRAERALERTPAPPPPPPGPAPRWQTRLGGAIYAPVALRGDTGFVGNADGVFFAVDLRDGSRRWSFAPGKPMHGEALVAGDAVYVGCDDGRLYKLSADDGRVLWRHELGDERVPRVPPNPFVFDYDHGAARPTLADGVVYIGAGDGGVHAVDAASGERRWRFQGAGSVRTSVTVLGRHLVVGTRAGTLHLLDRASGRETMRHTVGGPVTSTALALGGDRFIVGHRGSRLAAWQAGREQPLWEQNYWGSWIESSAVAAPRGDEAYIGSGDLFLVSAFDTSSGRNRWRRFVGGWVLQRPAVGERFVAVGVSGARRRPAHFIEQRSGVALLDRADGRIVWQWAAPTAPGQFLHGMVAAPVFGDHGLVVGGVDGSLYAFALPA